MTRTYSYDARGRLAQLDIGGTLGTRTDAYEYAEPGWLTREDRNGTIVEYGYDLAGNRISRDDGTTYTTYEYETGDRLNNVGGNAVTWDGTGGIVEDHRGNTILRGPDGSELGLDDATSTTLYDFVHDAYGRVVGTDDGTNTTVTFWDNPGADLPLGTIDEDGVGVLNVAAEGLLLGQLRDADALDAVSDLGGSLVLLGEDFLTPPGGFGEEASAVPTGTAGTERYVYAGLQSLPDAPYQLARQRMYDPELGRFTRMDPIGLAGGDHRFAYAANDPVGMWDPEGLSPAAVGGFWDDPETTWEDSSGRVSGRARSRWAHGLGVAADPAEPQAVGEGRVVEGRRASRESVRGRWRMIAEYPTRRFQFWLYRVGHGELLVRSPRDEANPRNVDLVFVGVHYVDLPRVLTGVVVYEASGEDVRRAEERLGRAVDRATIRVLETEGRRHLVVAAYFHVEENELDLGDLPFD